jgi:hypothetical protein
MLKPLGIGALISTIVIIFLYHCTNKKPRKGVQLGGFTPDLESVLAPLGKNNLLVLASLLLLHHFAIINYKDGKKDKKTPFDSKLKKVQGGGDLRPLLRGEYDKRQELTEEELSMCPIPDGVVPLAKWCLYSEMDPFMTLEMENNDSNLAGLVIAENLPDRLEGVKGDTKEAWDIYLKYFNCIQQSDYADYWAFFYQTWRLLALSQDVKLNTINLHLSRDAPWTKDEPALSNIRYTPVLTKQSALFNAWKLLCDIADTKHIPIRLTPMALIQAAKEEIANGTGGKKQDKKKKAESMILNGTSLGEKSEATV